MAKAKSTTIYDRGHDAARAIQDEHQFIPGMVNPDRKEFNLDMLRSLLYIAWRRGYEAAQRDAKRRGGK